MTDTTQINLNKPKKKHKTISYNTNLSSSFGGKGKGYSLSGRTLIPTEKSETPGPGAYVHRSTIGESPKFTMRPKTTEALLTKGKKIVIFFCHDDF